MAKKAISPTRDENFPEWYQQVVKAADLAENSPVRGAMVIKPWGYGIWERMQKILDDRFRETGHENAYFPLLIPLEFLQKEAEHVEGFAKECAVVTHHRLREVDGKLVPDSEIKEPLIIRPTSETIIGHSFAKWVNSWRDLPILINQWCNVMRWEMRTRLFLRTSEFLWQEGHTAHATRGEAEAESKLMHDIYAEFAEQVMAMPVVKGEKTPDERFPGALNTYTIEALMQDGKALQAGTSHFLGQNFAKASQIKFQNINEEEEYAWTTSWGVSTRLIGGLIMTHADDNGMVIPPRLAPKQVVIIPIFRSAQEAAEVLVYVDKLKQALEGQDYEGERVRVLIDNRDLRGGEKNWQWVKKGVPLKVEIGPRDVANNKVMVGRRDLAPQDKSSINFDEFVASIDELLTEIQKTLFQRAQKRQQENTRSIEKIEDFKSHFEKKSGFVEAYWHEKAIDHPLLKELSVTPRCMPLGQEYPEGHCVLSGEPTKIKVLFAKAY